LRDAREIGKWMIGRGLWYRNKVSKVLLREAEKMRELEAYRQQLESKY